MSKITIRNIGAIEDVSFDLNKVNVLIGPQSSGKSTIAKIISYCQWVEKRLILDGEYKDNFSERFMEFHRISESYFNDSSFIEYESNCVFIQYKSNSYIQDIKKVNEGIKFLNSKNIYIPAERNFVSAIKNLSKYRRHTNDNIMNFVYDWTEIRENHSIENKFPILNLGVSYYYAPDSDLDMILLDNLQKELSLDNASSGIQSLIPLLLPLEYMTGKLFKDVRTASHNEKSEIGNIIQKHVGKILHHPIRLQELKEQLESNKKIDLREDEITEIAQLIIGRIKYHFSQFILEEPEQNLFPETQRDLIYYILQKITSDENKDHRLMLTTHSPYILYALNNCMMASFVYDKMKESDKKKLKCKSAIIDPKKVSVYQIDNGKINCIQDEDGLIGENYFDNKMKDLMDDFYVMLNYYE